MNQNGTSHNGPQQAHTATNKESQDKTKQEKKTIKKRSQFSEVGPKRNDSLTYTGLPNLCTDTAETLLPSFLTVTCSFSGQSYAYITSSPCSPPLKYNPVL